MPLSGQWTSSVVGDYADALDASVNVSDLEIDVPVVVHRCVGAVFDAARLAKRRPGTAVRRVCVSSGDHVRACMVDA